MTPAALFGQALAQHFQQPVQPAAVDRHHGLFTHLGFGVVGHGQAGHTHHGQVVRAITHGDGVPGVNVVLRTGLKQHPALFLAVTNVAPVLIQTCAQNNIHLRHAIAMGDGANDLPMMGVAGLSVAYHAKPKVREQAMVAINSGGLDRLLEVLR